MNNIIQENNQLKGRLEFDDHKLLYHLKDVMDGLREADSSLAYRFGANKEL